MPKMTLRANNGQYVCAELDGRVVANRDAAGAWETFDVVALGPSRVALRTAHGKFLCAEGGGGGAVVADRAASGPWETFTVVPQGSGIGLLCFDGVHFLCAEGGGGGEVVANRTALGPWETFNGPVASRPQPPGQPPPQPGEPGRRSGLVRASGRHFVDDGGAFLPFGYSLFWAPRGWKDERDRIQQNIRHIAGVGADYFRLLCQVGWDGLETDPRWPGYAAILAELIDWAHDEAGIRPQLTLIGGGSDVKVYDRLVTDVIDVVAPRAHKVMFVEVANEWYGNFADEDRMKAYGKRLRDGLPNLVALSAPREEEAWKRSKPWVRGGFATMTTAHFDRDDKKADWKWRHVRKPWESRDPEVPSAHNEPGGPRSSVAQFEEPIHLVMSRAVGVLCGYDAYVLHNGSGIFGVSQDKYGGRSPNVWETPGIDACERAVRSLDAILPPRPSDGRMTRKGNAGHPLEADLNWPDENRDHGIVRDYAISRGDARDGTFEFWQALQGIKDFVDLKASGRYALEIVDPITHEVETRTVAAGATTRIAPRSRDSRGYGALIVKGRSA